MKKQRIYVDTSVIGGCFDQEFSIWSNGLFKDFMNGLMIPVISQVTIYEINEAPEYVIEKYNELLDYNLEIIEITDEASTLAHYYLKRKILTKKYHDDALHIAIATVAQVDVLVSWNFKHIVHYDKIRLFNGVNIELGYKPIAIYSPREVTGNG